LKIGIIVRILWSAGTQKFAIEEARSLQDEGHDVTLIFLRKTQSGDVYLPLLDGLNYKIMEESNTSRFVWLYDFLTGIFMSSRRGDGRVDYNLIRKLPKYIKDMDFDYLLCQDQWAGLGGYYCYKELGIKYAVIFHERVNNFPWMKGIKRIIVHMALRFQKKIVMNAHRIFAVTEGIARTVSNFYKGEVRVTAIFPGLKDNVIRNYSKKQNKIVLISFWNEIKTPEIYIPIFKEINDYKFIMAGNWTSPEYMEKFIDKLKKEEVMHKVTLLSSLSETQKVSLLQESKFFIRFGQGELGFATGTIEAMEEGIPIICNTGLGIAEYIKGYKFALVLENVNNTDKINQFLELVDNEEVYNSIQSDIVKMIGKYSWHKHASQLLQEIGMDEIGGINNNR
jgi:glycosyltransferase involved in cell wall biosynthesis